MIEHHGLWIGGGLVEPDSTAVIPVESPSTEEIIGSVPDASTADVDRAVAAARAAFDAHEWSTWEWEERAAVLQKAADILAPQADDLSRLVTSENGIMIAYRQGDVSSQFAWYLGLPPSKSERRTAPSGQQGLVVKEPVGVVAAILPWNAPVSLALGKVIPALLCGCSVIWKPAPETPLHAYAICEAFHQAGLPPGVLNLLTAGREVSEHLVAHPGVDMVSFTGSTLAGKRIGALCGGQVKRVALELGGKSAAIILDDFDVANSRAVLGAGMLRNSGQACAALTRLLVPRRREAELVDAFGSIAKAVQVGDPFDPATVVGPLIADRQRARVLDYIELARDEGAKVVVGGKRPEDLTKGYYVEPTLLASCTNDMRSSREEIFGPVASVIAYDTVDEAIAIANDSPYGLAGAVFSEDTEKATRVASRIRAGIVGVNTASTDIAFPFGGYRESGIGRQHGTECLHEYQEIKAIVGA
jgi:acyl-CoA reductase-like NAD-dependent aldehyde dehydrogenase